MIKPRFVLTCSVFLCLVFSQSLPPLAAQSASIYMNSAENRFKNGDLEGAIADMTQAIALDPTNATAFLYRGLMRMRTDNPDGAITDFTQAIALDPGNAGHYAFRGAAKNQKGDADGAIADSRRAIALDPKVLLAYKALAFAYYDKAYGAASDVQKREYISLGLEVADRALTIDDDYDALQVKGLFLRLQARLESDPAKQKTLLGQVETLRDRAQQIQHRTGVSIPGASIPPPPPPPPPPPSTRLPPVRVDGTILEPKKIKDVRPVYPAIALTARVQGVVIVEVTIGPDGKVRDATIVKSMPLLDAAALDAVRQWEFTPTLLNDVPVPIIATFTVNFTLK